MTASEMTALKFDATTIRNRRIDESWIACMLALCGKSKRAYCDRYLEIRCGEDKNLTSSPFPGRLTSGGDSGDVYMAVHQPYDHPQDEFKRWKQTNLQSW